MNEQDYIIAGGGLQGGLIALLLLDREPAARVTLIERGITVGGNHTWSFHASDVPPSCARAVGAIPHAAWDRYGVAFPAYQRTIACGYRSIVSTDFHRHVAQRVDASPNARLLLNTDIQVVGADFVVLAGGRRIEGRHVVDARGIGDRPTAAKAGFQKFVGLELQLSEPGPYSAPVLMDARVAQDDGFRFFYVLPFARDRILIEDTRFSDTPELDENALYEAVLAYAKEKGLTVSAVERVESGVLPMPYTARRTWPASMPLAAGYRGGFMHPATGYSFPVALRVADHIASRAPASPLDADWDNLLRAHKRRYRFAAFLNRLLFTAYPPHRRRHIFERFYRLPEPVIERFYRLEMTRGDMGRIFLGRPPRGFSLRRVLKGAHGTCMHH